jgi:hypothetical protein
MYNDVIQFGRLTPEQVRKRISFAPFDPKNDHFTKAGSGQT